jgi:hypothetical protein
MLVATGDVQEMDRTRLSFRKGDKAWRRDSFIAFGSFSFFVSVSVFVFVFVFVFFFLA